MKVTDFDGVTGDKIEREATADELAQFELDAEAAIILESEKQEKIAAKAALLDRLGITAEEATLLLG